MGLVRLVVFGFLALSVIYAMVWLYSRSVRREKLEEEWDAENPGGDAAAREAFVEQGMVDYHSSVRPKLIGLVYVIPTVIVVAILIFTN
ncbi:MAG: hypothetical protein AAF748_03700 [Pseudomonadota bacterium]